MTLDCQLSYKSFQERGLLLELISECFKLLACCVAVEERGLIFLDQAAELLDADEDLGDELGDLCLFPA